MYCTKFTQESQIATLILCEILKNPWFSEIADPFS